MKRFVDQKWKEAPLYAIGQKVWLDARNIQTKCPSKKLDQCQLSPFEVLAPVPHEAHSPSAYRLALPPSWKIHPVFHVSLLRPTNIDSGLHPVAAVEDHPPPDIIQGEEEYEVKAILDHRGGKCQRQYLIKWKGYPLSDVTWELRWALCHAPDVVNRYESDLEG
jgi:hypothetical protein